MNPTQQDPAYEYCLGSEALQKWGPKTEDMEMTQWPDEPETYTPVAKGSHYSNKATYRRKRQTTVQDGEEWICAKVTAPKEADFPVWSSNMGTQNQPWVCYEQKFFNPHMFTHWKHASPPAPPKPKQKTQEEIDEEAYRVWHRSTLNSDTSRPPIEQCWHAALAWERSRGKEDGK